MCCETTYSAFLVFSTVHMKKDGADCVSRLPSLACISLQSNRIESQPLSTCFGDDGRVLADARIVAAATYVLAEDSEGILVAHDQVGHGAAGPAVVLVDGEPLLEPQRNRRLNEAQEPSWRCALADDSPIPLHPCSSGPTSCPSIRHKNRDGLVRLCRRVTNLQEGPRSEMFL